MPLIINNNNVKKSKRTNAESRHIAYYGNLGTLNRDTIKKLKNKLTGRTLSDYGKNETIKTSNNMKLKNKLTGRTLSDYGKNETIKTSNNDRAGDIIIYTRHKIDVLASDLCQESAGS